MSLDQEISEPQTAGGLKTMLESCHDTLSCFLLSSQDQYPGLTTLQVWAETAGFSPPCTAPAALFQAVLSTFLWRERERQEAGPEPTLLWAQRGQGCAVDPEVENFQPTAVPSPLPPHPKIALNSLLVPEDQAGGDAWLRTYNLFPLTHL